MTDALIRRAEHADLAAIVQLRREWTQEQDGDIADPDFNENLAAWFARELSRRIMWLAEEGGRPAGMMNLAIYERMPRPGRALSRWGYLGNVFVLAAYRNRGIGSELVSAAGAVGTALTGGPPHRSQRAGLPHWAPTLGAWRRSALAGMDAQCGSGVSTGWRCGSSWPS
jgi:GNAT superfamily N-acetyltransferase